MAVFEYRGILVGTGKPTRGVRDAENAKALRALLRKDGVLLTSATEEAEAKEKAKKEIQLFSFMGKPSTSEIAVSTFTPSGTRNTLMPTRTSSTASEICRYLKRPIAAASAK